MRSLLAATVLAVVALARAGPGSSPRQARWFLSRADVTEVVEEEKLITQVTPWSCVVVAPSLPPCRHVRQLDIAATPPTPISATAGPVMPHFLGEHNQVETARRRYYLEQAVAPMGSLDSTLDSLVPVPDAPPSGWVPLMAREATAPLPAAPAAPAAPAPTEAATTAAAPAPAPPKREVGWAEWLGLRAHTVTSTIVKYATTRLVDPDTVVTFSVRGCQPSRLPFDLPLCVAPQTQPEATAPAVEISPAAPAPSAPAPAESPAAPAAPAAPEAAPSTPEKSTLAPIVVAEPASDKTTSAASPPAAAAPAATPAKA